MKQTALLVVDVQNALVRRHPHCQATLMECIKYLIAECRARGCAVLFSRREESEAGELAHGTDGWQIDPQLSPDYDADFIADRPPHHCFYGTGLHEHLSQLGVEELIVTGIGTEFCIDATVKAAHDLGYRVKVPGEGITTFDAGPLSAGQINEFYLRHVWPGHFAEILDAKDIAAAIMTKE